MRDEPVFDLVYAIKANMIAWAHQATVETHPGVKSALLSCSRQLRDDLRKYYAAQGTDEPDDAA